MADLRIVDAPVLLQESITDDVKMPTGGLGNFSVRLGDILWYVITKEQLANKNYVDLSSKSVKDSLDEHIADKANPHNVAKAQVGLGNVDNTADIDKPVSNAVSSAIITATNDMATKTYVNQKDNLKADKATTLSGYGITNAYTKDETSSKAEINSALSLKADVAYVDGKDGDLSTLATTDKTNLVKAINEVQDETKGVVALYEKNVEAGAGANGWDASLVVYGETTQKQINDGLESIAQLLAIENPRNGMRVYVKSYYVGLGKGGGTFIYDTTKSTVNDEGIVINGWVRDDTANLTPDMFGAKPNDTSFDNTDVLNRAFDTGQIIYGNKDDVYYVNGILNTKGQQLIGGWKINTSRYNLGLVSTEVEEIDHNRLRFCYVGTAYDLSELLHIKQLGFNTINFYGGFYAGTQDENGTILQTLDNAKTAKLRVNLNTEHGEAGVNLAKFVADYDNHPSVYCYTVFDEPATRNISVAQQDEKIALLRTMTKKPLTMVDLVLHQSPFLQLFSQNYDQVYVDSYSTRASNGDVNKDLEVMRIHYCLVKAMTKCDKVIPVCGLFQFKGSHYTDNVQQILAAAKIFSTVDGGNWGAFVWDGEGDPNIISNLRDNLDFKKFAKEANKQRDIKKPISDVYLFGGRNSEKDWGVQQLFKLLNTKDTSTTDDHINQLAYPITLTKGSSETDRTTVTALPTDVQSISGIAFRGNWGGICLDIPLRKKLRICLRLENFAKTDGHTYFSMHHSSDGGYSQEALWQDTQSSQNKVYETLIDTSSKAGRMLSFVVREPTTTLTNYRKLLMGYIIATDW